MTTDGKMERAEERAIIGAKWYADMQRDVVSRSLENNISPIGIVTNSPIALGIVKSFLLDVEDMAKLGDGNWDDDLHTAAYATSMLEEIINRADEIKAL